MQQPIENGLKLKQKPLIFGILSPFSRIATVKKTRNG